MPMACRASAVALRAGGVLEPANAFRCVRVLAWWPRVLFAECTLRVINCCHWDGRGCRSCTRRQITAESLNGDDVLSEGMGTLLTHMRELAETARTRRYQTSTRHPDDHVCGLAIAGLMPSERCHYHRQPCRVGARTPGNAERRPLSPREGLGPGTVMSSPTTRYRQVECSR